MLSIKHFETILKLLFNVENTLFLKYILTIKLVAKICIYIYT